MSDRLDRDWALPPQDLLAEAIVLRGFLLRPQQIDLYPEVGPLLWHLPHRQLWEVMQRVQARNVMVDYGHFDLELLRELRRVYPHRALDLWQLLDGVLDDQAAWQMQQYRAALERGERGVLPTDFHYPFIWWLERLRMCALARDLINQAQEVAEYAYRLDVAGAQRIAANAARMNAAVEGMDIPV